MIYERTYGGPDHNPNPVGMGGMAELGGKRRLPNIVHPARSAQPGVEPAGLAPISLEWAARRRMLRATPRRALEQPVVEIPDDLDPLYFQSAPADQRLPDPKPANAGAPFLRGDEWIVLEGLHKLRRRSRRSSPGRAAWRTSTSPTARTGRSCSSPTRCSSTATRSAAR